MCRLAVILLKGARSCRGRGVRRWYIIHKSKQPRKQADLYVLLESPLGQHFIAGHVDHLGRRVKSAEHLPDRLNKAYREMQDLCRGQGVDEEPGNDYHDKPILLKKT